MTNLKTNAIVTLFATLATLASTQAFAVYPTITVDGGIVVNVDDNVTVGVSVPTAPDLSGVTADVTNMQNLHDVTVNATGVVSGNSGVVGNITVDTTAVGNNANLTSDGNIGNVQGVQNTNIYANGSVVSNNLPINTEVEVNTTAVGNNLSATGVNVGNVQYLHDSNVSATGTISNNSFGATRPINLDPAVTVTSVGNNAAITGDVVVSNQQLVGVNVSAGAYVQSNVNPGTITVNATAVGNNIVVNGPSVE